MIVTIKRQHAPETDAYWQSFSYNGPEHVTVSAVLDALNYIDDLFDIDGNPAPRIRWECNCMQAVCGGCAMVINGVPALEILMRVFYGIALITGIVVLATDIAAVAIGHKVSAALFVALLAVLFVMKLRAKKG